MRAEVDRADLEQAAQRWEEAGLADLAPGLAHAVVHALEPEFAYVDIAQAGKRFVACDTPAGPPEAEDVETIGAVVALARGDPRHAPGAIPNPLGDGAVRLTIRDIGPGGQFGFAVVGARDTDTPNPGDDAFLDTACQRAELSMRRDSGAREDAAQGRLAESREATAALIDAGIQAQVAADVAVRDLEDLETLVSGLTDGVIVLTSGGRLVILNDAARRILDLAELADGDRWPGLRYSTVDGTALATHQRPIDSALRGETLVDRELLVHVADGTTRRCVFNSNAIRDGDGAVSAIIVTLRNVTQLRQLEQLRDEFLALITHDLRNPLAVVTAAAHRLERSGTSLPPHELNEIARMIGESSQRMNEIIAQVLEAASLEAGGEDIEREPVALAPLVASVVNRVREASGRQIELHVPRDPVHLLGNGPLLERATANLVDNALKYSPDDRAVVVNVSAEPGEVAVSVRDEGRGLSAEAQGHVFERLYRVREADGPGGYGLGLYLVRLIVEAHGGRVGVTSQEGAGSTFEFTLPLAADPSALDQ